MAYDWDVPLLRQQAGSVLERLLGQQLLKAEGGDDVADEINDMFVYMDRYGTCEFEAIHEYVASLCHKHYATLRRYDCFDDSVEEHGDPSLAILDCFAKEKAELSSKHG